MTGKSLPEPATIPGIFSPRFHTSFFPALIWSRLRPGKEEETSVRFSRDLEWMGLLVICILLIATGVSLAVKGAWLGWLLSLLGFLGVLTLTVFSIVSNLGAKPSYDNFLFGVFLLFVFTGLTAGLLVGRTGSSLFFLIGSGASGVLLGYFLGLLAGLWLQYLGWIASAINLAAGLLAAGLIVVDTVLLFH